jgi:membrane associated rhomboid family serine protease
MSRFGFGLPGVTNVVKNIIIINIIMVLAQFAFLNLNINLQDHLALHYWQSAKFRPWQLITHMFMHGSPFDVGLTITHIFFNMYGLYMLGGILEQQWGPVRFLAFYMVCGIGAGICQLSVYTVEFGMFHNTMQQFSNTPDLPHFSWLMHHNSMVERDDVLNQILRYWTTHADCADCGSVVVAKLQQYNAEMMNTSMVGASGAVFGVLFGFGYLFPNMELYLMFIPVPIKAKWFVAGYAAIELFSGFGKFANDNVAHFAHLGGMLFAFILLRLWNNKINNRYY